MNTLFFRRIPQQALVLLWLAYVLLGWYLSAHHIVWLLGAFIAAVALTLVWKSNPLLDRFVKLASQGFFVVLSISLIFSASLALATTWSILLTLTVIPLGTTILAEIEMSFAGFSRLHKFYVFTILAGLGLGFGELIDIIFLPSLRY